MYHPQYDATTPTSPSDEDNSDVFSFTSTFIPSTSHHARSSSTSSSKLKPSNSKFNSVYKSKHEKSHSLFTSPDRLSLFSTLHPSNISLIFPRRPHRHSTTNLSSSSSSYGPSDLRGPAYAACKALGWLGEKALDVVDMAMMGWRARHGVRMIKGWEREIKKGTFRWGEGAEVEVGRMVEEGIVLGW